MKKIILIVGAFVMLFSFVSCKNNYEYSRDDFNLMVMVNKTEVSVGDSIEVKVTLENLSKKNIKIQMIHTDFRKIEDVISIGLFKENEEHNFIMNSKGGPRKKMNIKKNEVITKTEKLTIHDFIDYEVVVLVSFYTGKGYNQAVSIYSDVKKIKIKE
jgi:lipoprotein